MTRDPLDGAAQSCSISWAAMLFRLAFLPSKKGYLKTPQKTRVSSSSRCPGYPSKKRAFSELVQQPLLHQEQLTFYRFSFPMIIPRMCSNNTASAESVEKPISSHCAGER
jgi:hypothetical protein